MTGRHGSKLRRLLERAFDNLFAIVLAGLLLLWGLWILGSMTG